MTVRMTTVEEWDTLYEEADPVPASQVLQDNLHLLPSEGKALDLACGMAENAFLLAQSGLEATAWDNSSVAVRKVNEKAKTADLPVLAIQMDILSTPFPKEAYDVIVFTHFLEQQLSTSVIKALKPGGLLFFQSFIRDKVTDCGPSDLRYQLARNELLAMFSDLSLVIYREEGRLGDTQNGFRNEAMLVAQKREII